MTDKQDDMLLERYHRANAYAAELEAENERLRNGDGLEYSLSLTNAALRAENERLRTALEKIAAAGNIHPSWLIEDAKAALGSDKAG